MATKKTESKKPSKEDAFREAVWLNFAPEHAKKVFKLYEETHK